MKTKSIILTVILALATFGLCAQNRPQLRHAPEPLEFHGDRDLQFTVFVNEVMQNHRPASCVRVTTPIDDNTTILIEVQENDRLMGRFIHLTRQDAHGLYYVVLENNLVDVYTSMQYDNYRRHESLNHRYGPDHGSHSNSHNGHGGHNGHDSHHSHNDYHTTSAHEFSHILSQISSELFDDSRLQLARSIFATHYFTSAQIRLIAEKFTFSSKRMEFAQMAYDHCVDKADYFVVADAFTFKSDKEKLHRFIQQQR